MQQRAAQDGVAVPPLEARRRRFVERVVSQRAGACLGWQAVFAAVAAVGAPPPLAGATAVGEAPVVLRVDVDRDVGRAGRTRG